GLDTSRWPSTTLSEASARLRSWASTSAAPTLPPKSRANASPTAPCRVRSHLPTIPTDASSPEVLGSVPGRPRLCTPTVAVTVARHPVDHRREVRRKHVPEATEPLRCGRSHRSVRLRFHPAWRLETASTSGLVWPVWCVLPYFSVTRASGGMADALASG